MDLLFEIGLEEVPAKFLPGAVEQLAEVSAQKFQAERISFDKLEVFATPRRLALIIRGVAEHQADRTSENRGPSLKIAFTADGPTKAAEGFARGQGITSAELVAKEGYVYAIIQENGRSVRELLPELLASIACVLNFPKNMRWGNLDMRFVRPIRWLVALFGREVIPLALAEINAGNITRGHRFLGKQAIEVASVDDYLTKLAENYCILDQNTRRETIKRQVEDLAISQGGRASIDEELLEEVTFLVEYPTALCGHFDEKYLTLPPEAVITLMREHQRYFPVLDAAEKLLPVFITVRNGSSEHLEIVQHGNERVLRARLSDAQFFYQEDQKIPLVARVEKLKTVVFQEGLGTIYDKTIRLQGLVRSLAGMLVLAVDKIAWLERSAFLSKADLTTGMVYEFTELQGIMGRQYAIMNGEEPEVADAIFEHYLPRFANDKLPETTCGRLLGIADKFDNIVATFSRGLIPTGSQDPYALRRQALGIVNIILAAGYHISTSEVIENAMTLLGIAEISRRQELLKDISEFLRLRLKNVLAEEGLRYDFAEAVLAAGTDDIFDVLLRARAIGAETGRQAVSEALQAFTRVQNLSKNAASGLPVPELLESEAEKKLFLEYKKVAAKLKELQKQKCYAEIYQCIASLAEPIDTFFAEVMVMADNAAVRNNRLALLKSITGLTEGIADLSKILSQQL